ncbi:MAG: cardiolipin synthase [Planctomycetota bacterium]
MDTRLVIAIVVIIGLWLALGLSTAVHAVMYKRDPRSAAVWLFVGFAMPVVGPWLYWEFGINRVKRRALRRRGSRERLFAGGGPHTPAEQTALDNAVGRLTTLRDIANRVTRLPLVAGNTLRPLHNGEQAYPEMLDAIRAAQSTISLESYIFDWDDVGKEFTAALGQAAARGVKVHVLLDGIGAVASWSRVGRKLLRSGAKVAAFFPLRLPLGRLRINLRNHRKLLIVDGRVGFTGGMNISQRHYRDVRDHRRVEDVHFRLEGPIVAQLQEAFVEDWYLATGVPLLGDEYFPTFEPCGAAVCRGIIHGPDEDLEKVHWIILAALGAAQQSVHIATPYFIPPGSLIAALATAALRGVRVTLILPALVDLPYMRWAADAYLWQLLEHGVAVYRRPAPFVHTKLMIVDRRWLLFGSANLDQRSFRLNFEFNVEAYDAALAASLAERFDVAIAPLQPVTKEAVDARPPLTRLRDGAIKLFSPHL